MTFAEPPSSRRARCDGRLTRRGDSRDHARTLCRPPAAQPAVFQQPRRRRRRGREKRVWIAVLSVWAMLAIVAVLAWTHRPAPAAQPQATPQTLAVKC